MKQPLIYGILCEDKAHRNFLKHYLNQCHEGVFQESQPFGWTIRASNNKEVRDALPDATRLGFTRFNIDVLFVGYDADTTDTKRIQEIELMLTGLCGSHPKVIFMVPVQCIEHWLLYLQWRRDNPISTKNESLEAVMRHEAKSRIYGSKLRVEKQLEIATQLLTNFDNDWLESRSYSFKRFHQRVNEITEPF